MAVVDLDQALNSTDEGKAAREELARKQREAEAKVQPQIERFKELQDELKSKKFVLSEEALYQRQLDLVELKNEIESSMKELEGKFKVDQERIVGPLRKKLIEIVQEIGREQGFTMIVERSTPGLLYSREALDITDDVIARFNKKKG
jgi:outer membrane protein